MKPRGEWVVAGGAAGEDAHCTRCGEGLILGKPVRIEVFVAASKAFVKAHLHCKAGQWSEPVPRDPQTWLAGRDTGVSSATICAATAGLRTPYHEHDVPHDAGDFGRCYRLLKLFPDLRRDLGKTVAICATWGPFVEHWDELTALYEEELPNKYAPRLCARIEELRNGRA